MRAQIRAMQAAMEHHGYIAEPEIALAVFLAKEMQKPLLVEGDAGVGKTEIAKVLARLLDTELIRLQCYEGLDVNTALYEWNYQRQLLRLRMAEQGGQDPSRIEEIIQRYTGPRFGFASRNFYAEFLAALELIQPTLMEHTRSSEIPLQPRPKRQG